MEDGEAKIFSKCVTNIGLKKTSAQNFVIIITVRGEYDFEFLIINSLARF